ncbi:MAG: hypothetical protein JXR76_03665 [Deltaproteobacteria bacterium]|nr:hypothetical protein [Deltaproteobacteria bacterium]
MKRYNENSHSTLQLLFTQMVFATAIFLLSCENDTKNNTVVLAVTPSAIEIGDEVVVTLHSLESVFTNKKVTPVASDGELIMRSLNVKNDKTALAIINTSRLSGPGYHTFELNFGDTVGIASISVLQEPKGPGTAIIENNSATAGAQMAKFAIWGEGTQFDSNIEVLVEGADGMSLKLIEVKTEEWVEVTYEIEKSQLATTA